MSIVFSPALTLCLFVCFFVNDRNNWHPKNFNAPRPSYGEFTMAIRCRNDHHSFLRSTYFLSFQNRKIEHISFYMILQDVQTYRNLSRHCKQYFLGDKQLEVRIILPYSIILAQKEFISSNEIRFNYCRSTTHRSMKESEYNNELIGFFCMCKNQNRKPSSWV